MDEPIRVAQVLDRMDSGGIEAMVLNYCLNIDPDKVRFTFLCSESSRLPQLGVLDSIGARVFLLPLCSKQQRYQEELCMMLRKGEYDIVHAQMSTKSVFPLWAAQSVGVPVRICHAHSTASWGEGARTAAKYLLRPLAPRFATDLFACGEAAGRWMYGDRRFDAGQVKVWPNAIVPERYAYDPGQRARLRASLGIRPDALVVGHVGRFAYQKNHELLLRIFAGVARERPDARLLLVGEGERRDVIRRGIEELGLAERVICTGVRGDVDKLYSAMDVFCLPSRYEGMPIVAWEALANGLPCVFSDRVTREADPEGRSAFLPLRAPLERWTQAVLAARRGPACKVPDVRVEAKRLERFYLERTKS